MVPISLDVKKKRLPPSGLRKLFVVPTAGNLLALLKSAGWFGEACRDNFGR